MSKQPWSCLTCTLENAHSDKRCVACDTERPQQYSLRFRTPTELFSLDLQPSTTVEILRVMLESRTGIPVKSQRLYYSSPRRELFGRDAEAVCKVLELKPNEPTQTITVEIRGLTSSSTSFSASSSSSAAASANATTRKNSEQWGDEMVDDMSGVEGDQHSRTHNSASPIEEDEDEDANFIAWLEYDESTGGLLSPASVTKAPIADDEMDGANNASNQDDDEGWGGDGAGDGDDGWGDAEEFETEGDEVTQAKQIIEASKEATGAVLQSSAKNKKLGEYECLRIQTLAEMMKKSLHELEEAIGCNMNEAAILMRYYRWNRDRLFQDYFEDPAKVQEKCGLSRMKRRNDAAKNASAGSLPLSVNFGECSLCDTMMTAENSLELACTDKGEHRFCHDCWRNWCNAEMDKGPQAIFTTCCGYKCKEIIPDDTFLLFLNPKKRRLLSRWLIRNYIDSKPNLKACINPRCSRILRYSTGGARDVECECGARFCFKCGHPESHSPCQCELVEAWNAKSNSENENKTWLLANTKPCPGCKTSIEKNSGCNHMTCKHCKHEFCWLCLGIWSKHNTASGGFYQCNIFAEAKKADSSISAQEKIVQDAQAKIARYNFYNERFMEYERSIKTALKSIAQTESRIETLQALTGQGLSPFSYLLDANKTVIECRRALKWSYVIAFYLKSESRQLHMFQIDQGQLEAFSDELHGLVELPIEQLLGDSHFQPSFTAPSASMKSPSSASHSKNTPSKSSHSSSSSTTFSPTSAAASVVSSSGSNGYSHLTGDELKKFIITKTGVANKYLNNLVDAVHGGQYLDLSLQRLPSV